MQERVTRAQPAVRAEPTRPVVTAASRGEVLSAETRAAMERSFGHDFSAVRIHESDDVGRRGAQAFTTGDQIHFDRGRFRPDTLAGRALLGHELAHVVQQRQRRVPAAGRDSEGVADDEALESEADRHGHLAARGQLIAQQHAASRSAPVGDAAPIQAKWIMRKGKPEEVPDDYELQGTETDTLHPALQLVLASGFVAPSEAARLRKTARGAKQAVDTMSWSAFTGDAKHRNRPSGSQLDKLSGFEHVGVHGTLRSHSESLMRGVRVPTDEEIVSEGNQLGPGFYIARGRTPEARSVARNFGKEASMKKGDAPYGVYDVLQKTQTEPLETRDLAMDETFNGTPDEKRDARLKEIDETVDVMTSPIYGRKGKEEFPTRQAKFTSHFLADRADELMVLPPTTASKVTGEEQSPARQDWADWTDANTPEYENHDHDDPVASLDEHRELAETVRQHLARGLEHRVAGLDHDAAEDARRQHHLDARKAAKNLARPLPRSVLAVWVGQAKNYADCHQRQAAERAQKVNGNAN